MNTFNDGDFMTTLSYLCHCLITFTIKKIQTKQQINKQKHPVAFKWKFKFSLCLYCLLPCHLTSLRSVWYSHLNPPHMIFMLMFKTHLIPLLSACLYLKDDPVPLSPWWPCTDLSGVTPWLSCTGEPSTEHPRCVSPALGRAARWSLSSCWKHSSQWHPRHRRPPLALGHTAGSVHILTSTCFSAELLSTSAPPLAWAYYSPVPELCVSFVHLHKSPAAQLPSLPTSPGMSAQPPGVSATPLSVLHDLSTC